MTQPVISVLTDHPRLVDEAFLERLRDLGTVNHYSQPQRMNSSDLSSVLRETDVAVTGWTSPLLPVEAAASIGKLKYICHMTGEMKRIIPPDFIRAGVLVTNWGDAFAFATAEGAVALLLSVLKDIRSLDSQCRSKGKCEVDTTRPFLTLKDTSVGLYGIGAIGRCVAEMLRPFGPRLFYYDPYVADAPLGMTPVPSLRDLFTACGIVSVHCGLTDATRGSVTYDLLSLLPDGGILINTSRGAVVNEKDLAKVLKTKRILAGIDVITDESDWRRSPLVDAPNVTLTGHSLFRIGPNEKTILQEVAFTNIKAFLEGHPVKHVINEKRYWEMT